MKNLSLGQLLAISIFVAAVNVALPFLLELMPIGHLGMPVDELSFYVSLCIAGVWVSLVVFALRAHGSRASWLLIGMPIALYWPVLFVLFALGFIDVAI
jgi:hypothetical protein